MVEIKLFNKRGDETSLFEMVIFIILNLAFIAILLVFVFRTSSGTLVYEQAYSKQIGLMIDEARPDMIININMDKMIEIAAKNGLDRSEIVKIDDVKKEVIVRASSGSGFVTKYFSGYAVSMEKGLGNSNYLVIKVGRKNE